MLGITIETVFDETALAGQFSRIFHTAAGALGDAVMEDCEIYVPYDTGALCRSAARRPVTEEDGCVGCDIVWSAPHASAVYYGDARGTRYRTEHHAHARARWFEGARAVCGEKWNEVVRGSVAAESAER